MLTNILFFLIIVMTGLGVWFSFSQTGLYHITGYAHSVIVLAGFLAFARVWKAYQKSREKTHKYFSFFLLGWALCGLSMSLTSYFLFPITWLAGLNLAIDIALFMFLGTASLIMVIVTMKAPQLEKGILSVFLALSGILLAMNILQLPQPSISPTGVTLLGVNPLVGLIFMGLLILLMLVGAFFFFINGLGLKPPLRGRSFMIGSGVLFMGLGISAYTFSLLMPPREYFLNGLFAVLVAIGMIITSMAVVHRKQIS